MHKRIKTYEIVGKDQSPNVHGRIKLSAKNEWELETLLQTVRIYSQDRGMEFSIKKMLHANNEKGVNDIWPNQKRK